MTTVTHDLESQQLECLIGMIPAIDGIMLAILSGELVGPTVTRQQVERYVREVAKVYGITQSFLHGADLDDDDDDGGGGSHSCPRCRTVKAA